MILLQYKKESAGGETSGGGGDGESGILIRVITMNTMITQFGIIIRVISLKTMITAGVNHGPGTPGVKPAGGGGGEEGGVISPVHRKR
jgi:hypothetical protein